MRHFRTENQGFAQISKRVNPTKFLQIFFLERPKGLIYDSKKNNKIGWTKKNLLDREKY